MESDPGEYHSALLDILLLFSSSPLAIGVALAMIALLLCGSALISGSEVAFFSLDPKDMDSLRREGTPVSKNIIELLEFPRYLLATVLIANNFINISIVMISTFVVDSFEMKEGIFALLVNVVLVTFLLVLFGEVTPKVYANINNIKLARLMAKPLLFVRKICYPLSTILVKSTKIIEKRMAKSSERGNPISMKEIDRAIDLTVKDHKGASQDAALLKSIVQFGNVSVQQIMRARVDVVAVDQKANFEELLAILKDSNHSRIPIYEDNFDTVTGILYAKDLLKHLDKNNGFQWQKLIRAPFFVPETKKIDDLLEDFQARRTHMAIVVDEYGGTSGIVTLEDVLEEIIGEIKDEFDESEAFDFQRIDERNFIFEGKTMLNDVCRLAKLEGNAFDAIKGDSNSLAGLILELAGRMPLLQEEVVYNNFKFKIMAVDQRRIKKIMLTIQEKPLD